MAAPRSDLIRVLEGVAEYGLSQEGWEAVLELLVALDQALVAGYIKEADRLATELRMVDAGPKGKRKTAPLKVRRQLRQVTKRAAEGNRQAVRAPRLRPGPVGALINLAPRFGRGRNPGAGVGAPALPGSARRRHGGDPMKEAKRTRSADKERRAQPPQGEAPMRSPRAEPPRERERPRTTRASRGTRGGGGAAPAPPPPEELVEVSFGARMPNRVALGDEVTVRVTVTREELAKPAAGETAADDVSRVEKDQPLGLQVAPRIGFEVRGKDEIDIPVPDEKEPVEVEFKVAAVHASPGEVWVLVRQGSLPLAVLKLETEIVEDGATSDEATTAETRAGTGRAEAAKTLDINERAYPGQGVVYEYRVDFANVGVFKKFESAMITGDRSAYVASLYGQLEEWARKPGDPEDLEANLRSFGGDLFDELFPPELQGILWEHRDELQGVMVLSTEPFIPWELVHLKPPGESLPDEVAFLGQKGMVRWTWERRPPTRLTIRDDRRRYVVPEGSGLSATQAERKMLTERLNAVGIDPQVKAVRKALGDPDAFDLLHFAGHAEGVTADITQARILLDAPPGTGGKSAPLLAAAVRNYSKFGSDAHRPLVVLNACQSGRAGIQLTSLGGFAEAFLEKEAGAFVGTMWAVGDDPALTFVEALYERLLAGDTFAAATAAAREKARAEGDPTWLAYTVYAHPEATIDWST